MPGSHGRRADERNWVSRGAHKLIGALDAFDVSVEAAAASTRAPLPAASPKYCLIAMPARSSRPTSVTAAWRGRCVGSTGDGDGADQRPCANRRPDRWRRRSRGRRPVVHLAVHGVARTVSCASVDADIVPMVKPQFEVGKDRVGPGGVVSDPRCGPSSVLTVARRAAELGWHGRRRPRPVRCRPIAATSNTSCACVRGPMNHCLATRSRQRFVRPSRRVRSDRTHGLARRAHRSRRGDEKSARRVKKVLERQRRRPPRAGGRDRRSRPLYLGSTR